MGFTLHSPANPQRGYSIADVHALRKISRQPALETFDLHPPKRQTWGAIGSFSGQSEESPLANCLIAESCSPIGDSTFNHDTISLRARIGVIAQYDSYGVSAGLESIDVPQDIVVGALDNEGV